MEEEEEETADFCRISLFHSDRELCSADILPPIEARARIEVAVLNFLRLLFSASPTVPRLPLVNRRLANTGFRRGLMSDFSSIFLSHSFCSRSLMRSKETKAFVRVWKIMQQCFQILGEEKIVTQRELFYKLLCDSPDYFASQTQVNRGVQDAVALLRCSRQSLGIIASSRGAIIGRLILEAPDVGVVDCSKLGPAGYAISGDLNLLGKLVFHSDARYIIIVEKDAIFQRLAEDRIFNQIPSILITAKGFPDIATRFLLHRLCETFSEVPIFAFVDWYAPQTSNEAAYWCQSLLLFCRTSSYRNPGGLAILCTYKFGSISMGLEAYRYACNVKWLGLRADDMEYVSLDSMMDLRPRDRQIAKSLMSSNMLLKTYREELKVMIHKGKRVEIEALYCNGFDFLGKYISKKIVQGNYI